jgi:GNAT superfamily N-acetyltransferase
MTAPDGIAFPLTIDLATEADVTAIAALRVAVAAHLTQRHGRGAWSSAGTEAGVRRALRTSRYLTARGNGEIVGALRLTKRRPWAIDSRWFTPVARPLYLLDMAVTPKAHGRGIGRRLLHAAQQHARGWPSDTIRLDAYDAPAGVGTFYSRCGYREVGRVVYRKTPLVYYELLLCPAANRG